LIITPNYFYFCIEAQFFCLSGFFALGAVMMGKYMNNFRIQYNLVHDIYKKSHIYLELSLPQVLRALNS